MEQKTFDLTDVVFYREVLGNSLVHDGLVVIQDICVGRKHLQ